MPPFPYYHAKIPQNSKSRVLIQTDDIFSLRVVLIFGDPDNGESVGDIPDDKVHVICRKFHDLILPPTCGSRHESEGELHTNILLVENADPLDGICAGTSIVTPAHLDYQDDADAAAEWVADYLGY